VFCKLSKLAKFCAGYIYDFPSSFSSLAYYWGIVVAPAARPAIRFGEQEARRLESWRDNTEIGILVNDSRRFYGPCDGYVRDVYPTMILSECHRRRVSNGGPMIDFLARSLPLSVEHVGDKIWIRVQNDQLLRVQQSFDEHKISLSGGRIVH
jgi:hypothetical protein